VENKSKRPSGPRRKFTAEFKRDAVAVVRANPDRSIKEIADELGVYDSSLGNWVR
jgi:transposase